MTMNIDAGEFAEKVLEADGPVLVVFFAEWSDICVEFVPLVDEFAKERTGTITFAKVNIDTNHDTCLKYGVRSVPTLIVFKDGKLVSMEVGSMSKGLLGRWINSLSLDVVSQ